MKIEPAWQGQVNAMMCRLRPANAAQLRSWIRVVLGLEVPWPGRCEGHASPMDYLAHVFFERPGDAVVWANRGGGKTFYGALATLLDLLYKPGIEVRILGGSFDQSSRMYRYLRWMVDRPGLRQLVAGRRGQRGMRLVNGSAVEVLAQSQTAVRGQRVQKLRCDEVELFDRQVWQAAQFVTRSARCGPVAVRGSVEALSTMHRPYGLMHELVEQAERGDAEGPVLFKWCVLDVMDRCRVEGRCRDCLLAASCRGRARRWRGFIEPEDVLAQRRRSSAGQFGAEMLCRRPSRTDAVFPQFDPAVHVRAMEARPSALWVGGVDFGLRSPFVMLWAQLGGEAGQAGGRLEVIDEYVVAGRTLGEHLAELARRPWPRPAWLAVDPAGCQRNEQTGQSNVALLRQAGYRVRAWRRPLVEGLERVRRRLESGPDGGPGLWIHPRCKELVKAMSSYHFDADRPDRLQPVKDGYDHPVDALRYLVVCLDGRGGPVQVQPY